MAILHGAGASAAVGAVVKLDLREAAKRVKDEHLSGILLTYGSALIKERAAIAKHVAECCAVVPRDTTAEEIFAKQYGETVEAQILRFMILHGVLPSQAEPVAFYTKDFRSAKMSDPKSLQCDHIHQLPGGLVKDWAQLDLFAVQQYFRNSENVIFTLPPEIGLAVNLTKLFLTNAGLEHLPREVGDCVKLEEVELDDNHLTELPDTISKWGNLRRFTVHQNALREFPVHLQVVPGGLLDLVHNKISVIPDTAQQMLQDTKVQTLNLSNNPIDHIPAWLAELPELTKLNILHTGVTEVPDALWQKKGLKIIGVQPTWRQTVLVLWTGQS